MKTIVYYYSHKGSNKYLATKIAHDLNADMEEIRPILNAHLLMLLGLNFGNRKLKTNVADYDRVILCGPIWMGKLIVPLRNFVQTQIGNINKLIFVTCCGSTFEGKDKKFGHNLVFNVVKRMAGAKCIHCEAFPIQLVAPDALKEDSSAYLKVHMSPENFTGDVVRIYESFIQKIKNSLGDSC